jgi:acetyl-CoA C-acetyltransferase
MTQAYIVQALRTAGGRRGGRLSGWHPADLAAEILNAIVDRSGVDPAAIEDVIMGCVSMVGEQSFHIGRNAVMASRLPDSVPAVSIDRQCGSSQQAVQFAAQAVMSGTQDLVIAAGVESMSRVPMGSPTMLAAKAGVGTGPWSDRIKARYGVDEFSQFAGAEMLAMKYGLTREVLDAYALASHRKACAATDAGAFRNEIVPIASQDSATAIPFLHEIDEGLRRDASIESIGSVRLLREGGRISAANASQMCDGAAGVLVASARALQQHGLQPIARIHSMHVSAGDPVIMLEEPIRGTRLALQKAGLKLDDIGLFEVNEAFASVPLAWMAALNADPSRVNVNGGAIALGHPLGATGAKLLSTLIHALRARQLRFGLQTMCEGGGMANMTIIEAL